MAINIKTIHFSMIDLPEVRRLSLDLRGADSITCKVAEFINSDGGAVSDIVAAARIVE
jgi:hypothetical protein